MHCGDLVLDYIPCEAFLNAAKSLFCELKFCTFSNYNEWSELFESGLIRLCNQLRVRSIRKSLFRF